MWPWLGARGLLFGRRLLLCVAAFAYAAPALAATPVFVDTAGVCAGLLPCFTTIQAGVNNAGPPPAIVNVFPGDYGSVDVGLMGSAIAGSTGDLTLRTVNAAGNPSFGTARIVPLTGPGIFNTAAPFVGDLFIGGFTVQSPDDDGITLGSIQGTVELQGVVSDDNDGGGLTGSVTGDLRAIDSSFSDNDGGDGLSLTADGDLVFERVSADGNSSDGAVATIVGNVRIDDSTFNDNQAGDGLSLTAEGDLDIDGTSFNRNASDGAVATIVGNVRIHDSTFNDNQGADGLSLTADGDLDVEGSSFDRNASDGAVVTIAGNVRIQQSTFDDNKGADGLSLTADGDLDIEGSSFNRNADDGAVITVSGPSRIRDSSFSGNTGGDGLAFAGNTSLDAAGIVANDNADDGLSASVASALIVGSRFEGNGSAGVRLSPRSPEGPYLLRCSDIAGNEDGLLLTGNATVLAELNFWGDPSGPTHPSNPGGTGDTIRDAAFGGAGTVDFEPFLKVSASESGECAARPAPALDWAGLVMLSLALFVLPVRRLMRATARA